MNNLVFNSKKLALEFLASVEGLSESNDQHFVNSGTYYLSNGEYSRPNYTTRRYKGGWGIHVAYHYYAGTFNSPRDGRVDPETFVHRFS